MKLLLLSSFCFIYILTAYVSSLPVHNLLFKASVKESAQLPTKIPADKSQHIRSRSRSHELSPDKELTEYWDGHNKFIRLAHWNQVDHVVIYFDLEVAPETSWIVEPGLNEDNMYVQEYAYNGETTWLFNFTSQVWAYMTRLYGEFGHDPYFYLVIHQGHSRAVYTEFSIDSDKSYEHLNVLDISLPRQDAWLSPEGRPAEMDLILKSLASFVERSSKQRRGSPSFNIWAQPSYEDTAWADIFTYDVYTTLNMTQEAERFKLKTVHKVESSPKKITFWFKDWFLPIYTEHGGNKALNNYFVLLVQGLPHRGEDYSANLTLGEFVHFWSGAANTDLKHLACTAFSWNTTYEEEFNHARKKFTGVTELYSYVESGLTECVEESNSKTSERRHDHTVDIAVGVTTTLVIFLILVLYLCFYKKKIRELKTDMRKLTKDEVNAFFKGNPNVDANDAHALVLSMPFIQEFEIPRDKMVLDDTKVLGTGQFGNVVCGSVRLPPNNEMISVAIKTVKPNMDIDSFKAFLSEVKIMAYLGKHDNIVGLLGTCTDNIRNREIFIALESCTLGNLEDYLKKNRQNFESPLEISKNYSGGLLMQRNSGKAICFNWQDTAEAAGSSCSSSSVPTGNISNMTVSDLIQWSLEISNAMMYLTQKKVIHGDLAARNVLLTDKRVAKVSDFGLSRQFLNYANYMKTSRLPVPWRWLSIEALKEMKFSTASDVWAFGVTMWEIFSLGEPPYGAWTYDLFFVDKLANGERLLSPTHANPNIYLLMKDCWKTEPSERPTFQQVHQRLRELHPNGLKTGEGTESHRHRKKRAPLFPPKTLETHEEI